MASRPATLKEEKQRLREQALSTRASVPPGEREEAAARLAKGLPRHPLLEGMRPGGVLVPTRHGHEIDTAPLARALEGRGWLVHRPRVIPGTQEFEVVRWPTPSPLVPGTWKVPEPPARVPANDPSGLRLILVPGLAFTRAGDRLGTGAGYFDRFLAKLAQKGERPVAIGLAFRAQILEELPVEPHDVPLDGLQVEEESVVCHPEG